MGCTLPGYTPCTPAVHVLLPIIAVPVCAREALPPGRAGPGQAYTRLRLVLVVGVMDLVSTSSRLGP